MLVKVYPCIREQISEYRHTELQENNRSWANQIQAFGCKCRFEFCVSLGPQELN